MEINSCNGNICINCGLIALDKKCSRCKSRFYCNQECQRNDWPRHKQECQYLANQLRLEEQAKQYVENKSQFQLPWSTIEEEKAPLPKITLSDYDEYQWLQQTSSSMKEYKDAPVGIENISNTCYANSIIQCLLYTPCLMAYFIRREHQRSCNKPTDADWCFLCEFEKIACQYYSTQQADITREFTSFQQIFLRLQKFSSLQYGKQEDASEFLDCILSVIEKILLRSNLTPTQQAVVDVRSKETTLLHHIFGGYLRNETRCQKCPFVSKNYNSQMMYQIEIHKPHITNIQQAVKEFTVEEILDVSNQWKCSSCDQYSQACKQTLFEILPNILVVNLKRFTYDDYGNRFKVNKPISYGQTLNLSKLMAQDSLDNNQGNYRLYAVVIHQHFRHGIDSGHYVSFVRNGANNWFQCNDENIMEAKDSQVYNNPLAYLLFYERIGTRKSTPQQIYDKFQQQMEQKQQTQNIQTAKGVQSWSTSSGDDTPHSSPAFSLKNQADSTKTMFDTQDQNNLDCVIYKPRDTVPQFIKKLDTFNIDCTIFVKLVKQANLGVLRLFEIPIEWDEDIFGTHVAIEKNIVRIYGLQMPKKFYENENQQCWKSYESQGGNYIGYEYIQEENISMVSDLYYDYPYSAIQFITITQPSHQQNVWSIEVPIDTRFVPYCFKQIDTLTHFDYTLEDLVDTRNAKDFDEEIWQKHGAYNTMIKSIIGDIYFYPQQQYLKGYYQTIEQVRDKPQQYENQSDAKFSSQRTSENSCADQDQTNKEESKINADDINIEGQPSEVLTDNKVIEFPKVSNCDNIQQTANIKTNSQASSSQQQNGYINNDVLQPDEKQIKVESSASELQTQKETPVLKYQSPGKGDAKRAKRALKRQQKKQQLKQQFTTEQGNNIDSQEATSSQQQSPNSNQNDIKQGLTYSQKKRLYRQNKKQREQGTESPDSFQQIKYESNQSDNTVPEIKFKSNNIIRDSNTTFSNVNICRKDNAHVQDTFSQKSAITKNQGKYASKVSEVHNLEQILSTTLPNISLTHKKKIEDNQDQSEIREANISYKQDYGNQSSVRRQVQQDIQDFDRAFQNTLSMLNQLDNSGASSTDSQNINKQSPTAKQDYNKRQKRAQRRKLKKNHQKQINPLENQINNPSSNNSSPIQACYNYSYQKATDDSSELQNTSSQISSPMAQTQSPQTLSYSQKKRLYRKNKQMKQKLNDDQQSNIDVQCKNTVKHEKCSIDIEIKDVVEKKSDTLSLQSKSKSQKRRRKKNKEPKF